MSHPVDPPPDEIEPSPEFPPPVWDGLGARWTWVPERKAYVCDDPRYTGPEVNVPGGIPDERQPFYAHPPTDFERELRRGRHRLEE